jgi:glycosyltransferase involved in cell wall biosynthesis
MKIAFVTTYDAQNIRNWSGTPFYMSKALMDEGATLEFIGNLEDCPDHFSFRLKDRIFNKILKGKLGTYYRFYEPRYLKYYSEQVQKRVEKMDIDIILSPGALPVAYLNTGKPIVMWSDATFAAMLGYYPEYSHFSSVTKKNCNLYEKNLFQRARLSCFSSGWAADSAIQYYKADPGKVKVLPYGANLVSDRETDDIVKLNNKKSKDTCQLLFIGKDWERKGADTAIAIAGELNKLGLKSTLHLVGINEIPIPVLPDFVINHGFLSKDSAVDKDKINELFGQSHFFVLPTKADCTPIVFSEANSFGLPVITSNTGGIPSIITNDVNGKLLAKDPDIKSCAEYIKEVFTDFDRYIRLSLSSFNEYKARLNWKVSASKIMSYMENILSNAK